MADITQVRAAADRAKADLNEKLKEQIASLTSAEIKRIIDTLEIEGINPEEVQQLKAEIACSTNRNQILTRVLEAPGALCEQLKNIIGKLKK